MNSYENYKDSKIDWVGLIPQHWEVAKPKYKLNRVTRPTAKDDEVITCFRDGVVTLRKNRREDGFTISLKEHGYQQICPGDLVVHEMDGFAGAIGISDSKGKSTPVYTVIEPNQNADLKYISYLLRLMSKTGKIESLARSIRERTTDFRWNMWSVIDFPFPPVLEQKIISKYLDQKNKKIDSLIAKIIQKIELIKEQKTALINEYIKKGLNPNASLKDSGVEWIGEIPEHWEIKKLKYLINKDGFIRGPFGSSLKIEFFVENGYKVYAQKNAIYSNLSLGDSFIDADKFKELSRFKIQENDILMSCSGTIGKTTLIPKDFKEGIINQALLIIRLSNYQDISPEYLQKIMTSYFFEMQIIDNSQGGAMKNLVGIDIFKNIKIPIPSQEEQKLISKTINQKNKTYKLLIENLNKKKNLLEKYRESLIHHGVTGKIRIKEDML